MTSPGQELIGRYQLVQQMIARMSRDYEICRLLYQKVAWMKNTGLRHTRDVSMAKQYATDAAFNALLKTLEEPPAHVKFILATTQPEDIPQTIRSRCQHFSFHAVRSEEIVGQLRAIARQEGIQADDKPLRELFARFF